ncbi:purine-cytosine permease family protein [Conexivisphaera calida]|uniref:Cytosine/purine/uracil/thiamine/allantoin permease family protein n=1 Tax=Conexivisphaera calida TaxID=1874277 RepID=A0A4P2VDS6_9ARCH|nr:cytosine permease [Conexivisphaera calida]BBE42714.1 Cytosine/purine/uracil/thiamine/allantoin permease family protein [Conexivisphaera calida]
MRRGPERKGIEHVEDAERHGRPLSVFILWFASNLTIADYALGSVLYGLPLPWIYAIIVGVNVAAGALLGAAAAMGPRFGLPQMAISERIFGRIANKAFATAQWLSTIGWFSVNTVIATLALLQILDMPYWAGALVTVAVMAVVGIYGHDAVHGFERAMSVVLGAMFVILSYAAVRAASAALPHYQASPSPFVAAMAIASVFSYLASWAPYASDYSRYLPEGTSRWRIAVYAMVGGAAASAWIELIGTAIYVAAGNPSLDMMSATVDVVGRAWAPAVMIAIFLGGLAANALNLYSNSVSAQAISARFRRIYAAAAGAAIGYGLSVLGGMYVSFTSFYEGFLLLLDYWIMPWAGVLIAAVYARRRGGAREAIISYVLGMAASTPFMNLTPYGVQYVGPVAAALGGADLSYFVSFAVAIAAYLLLDRMVGHDPGGLY